MAKRTPSKPLPSKPATSKQHDELIGAARSCYLKQGISATGMRDVASVAGVARSTLYRYFPGRDELLVAVIRTEMEAANAAIQGQLEGIERPDQRVVEGLVLALREIPARPLLAAVFVSDQDARARRVIWQSQVVIDFGEELMDEVIQPALEAGILQDQVRPEMLIEWVYRVLLSFLTLPSNWAVSESELRATLRALLIPVLLKQ